MSPIAVVAMLIPAVAAYLLLRRPWREQPSPVTRAVAASLAPSLGLGFASCLHFLLLLTEMRRPVILRADAAVWSLVIVLLGVDAWRRRGRVGSADGASRSPLAIDRVALFVVAAGALVLFALVARTVWVHATLRPHGEWDAWAVWNLRARAILRGAPDWTAVLSERLAPFNVDYPLLLPLTTARLWAFNGNETTLIPTVVAFTFFASTIATVSALVGQTRGWVSGLLSGAVLVAPHAYVFQGTCQCADVPLAQFVLVAVSCGAMTRMAGENRTWLAVAGAAAGLAAWTKNEGQLLLLVMLIALAAWPTPQRKRTLMWFSAGASAPLATLLWFKLRLAPANYLFTPSALASLLERLRDGERWSLIRAQMSDLLPTWGDIPGGALLLLAGVVVVTARVNRRDLQRCAFGLSVLVAMMIGYALVYAITPLPLLWQILTSFTRLMTQLWPALVWTLFQLSSAGRDRGAVETTA